ADDVHVVVLDSLVRGVDVVADRGADPRHFAGGDRRADAGAADEHAALGASVEDRLAELVGLVGGVGANRVGVRPEVDDHVPRLLEGLKDPVAEMDAAVVEGDGDVHFPDTPVTKTSRWLPPDSLQNAGASQFGRTVVTLPSRWLPPAVMRRARAGRS